MGGHGYKPLHVSHSSTGTESVLAWGCPSPEKITSCLIKVIGKSNSIVLYSSPKNAASLLFFVVVFVENEDRTGASGGSSTGKQDSTDIGLLKETPDETWADVVKRGTAMNANDSKKTKD
jgi:hypothetical protein